MVVIVSAGLAVAMTVNNNSTTYTRAAEIKSGNTVNSSEVIVDKQSIPELKGVTGLKPVLNESPKGLSVNQTSENYVVQDDSPFLEKKYHIGTFSVIGIQTQINLYADDAIQEIQKLWDMFEMKDELHQAVNWNRPVVVYAVYKDIDEEGNTTLAIGYDQAQTSLNSDIAVMDKKDISAGLYQKFPVNDLKGMAIDEILDKAWADIYSGEAVPEIVLEEYNLDSSGNPKAVHVFVR